MTNASVSQGLITVLQDMRETTSIKVIGDLIKMIPITDAHAALVDAWRSAAERMGLGAPTHPVNEAYRQHWATFVEEVAQSVMCQVRT